MELTNNELQIALKSKKKYSFDNFDQLYSHETNLLYSNTFSEDFLVIKEPKEQQKTLLSRKCHNRSKREHIK